LKDEPPAPEPKKSVQKPDEAKKAAAPKVAEAKKEPTEQQVKQSAPGNKEEQPVR